MAVGNAGFSTFHDPWHMAANTIGEGMNGMSTGPVEQHMAAEALLRTGFCRRSSQPVDIVAGGASHTFLGMYGDMPVGVLLMVPLRKCFGIGLLHIGIGI